VDRPANVEVGRADRLIEETAAAVATEEGNTASWTNRMLRMSSKFCDNFA
jgi:hypothetical protein